MALRNLITASLVGLVGLAAAEPVPRAAFTQVTNYGDNPSNTSMYLYVPKNLASHPAVIVGIHWCHGSASAYYAGTQFAAMSEQYGYIVIYPESPYLSVDGCWDVASRAALTYGGGGDSNSIANMVRFVLREYGADSSRVYVSGISSGAMMTNVMVGAYPELFAAGSVYAGVPAGCFYSANDIPDYWNGTCAEGGSVATQEYWANFVRNMYPGYNGPRPKLRIHHGTADEVLDVTNYYETIKQWTGIFGYSTGPHATLPNNPYSPYTTYIFGDMLQGILGDGVSHNIAHDEVEDLKWFGIYGQVSTTTTAAPTTAPASSTTSATTTTTSASGAFQTHWGQCGGIGYTGATNCESPYTCRFQNDWYSQCL